jgi:tetratricopeptide (TPR) repeat protein
MERARELDPMGAERHGNVAWAYWVARRYDDAIRLAQEAIELDSTASIAYQALGGAYVEKGRYADAAAAFENGFARSGGNRIFLPHLGYAYARVGRTPEARRILTELQELYRSGLASPYFVAWTYLGLGERDRALSWLETTENEGHGHILFLRANPVWDPLRCEPRFQALLRKVGLG